MFTFLDLVPFLFATVMLNLTPGNDVMFIATQSIKSGFRGGVLASLGVSFGCLFHTCAVAFGLAELLAVYPIAFNVIKVVGASYLFYLAYQALTTKASPLERGEVKDLAYKQIFWRGALTNILNPKAAMFFLAFFPQFMDLKRGSIFLQSIILGVIFITSATIINSAYAYIFSVARERVLSSMSFRSYLNKITAGVFGMLAVKILL